jgi:hypothetical protein
MEAINLQFLVTQSRTWDRRNLIESQKPRVDAYPQIGKALKGGVNRNITSVQVMGHEKLLVKP